MTSFLPRITKSSVGGLPLLGIWTTYCFGILLQQAKTLYWYTTTKNYIMIKILLKLIGVCIYITTSELHLPRFAHAVSIHLCSSSLTSFQGSPRLFGNPSAWNHIPHKNNPLQKHIKFSLLNDRYISNITTNQTNNWWKPSSHKNPLGNTGRLGTAVYSSAGQYSRNSSSLLACSWKTLNSMICLLLIGMCVWILGSGSGQFSLGPGPSSCRHLDPS